MVDILQVELAKENIQSTTSGRSIHQLSEMLSRAPESRQAQVTERKNRFEQRILDPSERSSLLDIYFEYVTFLIKSYPENPNRNRELVRLLERSIKDLQSNGVDEANSSKYLKIWLLYVTYSEEAIRNELFLHMKRRGIGRSLELFYTEYAKYLEYSLGKVRDAESVLKLALKNEAQPFEKLISKYNEFLGRNGEALKKAVQASEEPQVLSTRDNRAAAFQVFSDTVPPAVAGSSAGESFTVPPSRASENEVAPVADWSLAFLSPTTSQPPATRTVPVFHDVATTQSAAYQVSYRKDLFLHAGYSQSFERWRLDDLFRSCPLSQMTAPARITTAQPQPQPKSVCPKNVFGLFSPTINTKTVINEVISLFGGEDTAAHAISDESDSFEGNLSPEKQKFKVFCDSFNSPLPSKLRVEESNPFLSNSTTDCLTDITECTQELTGALLDKERMTLPIATPVAETPSPVIRKDPCSFVDSPIVEESFQIVDWPSGLEFSEKYRTVASLNFASPVDFRPGTEITLGDRGQSVVIRRQLGRKTFQCVLLQNHVYSEDGIIRVARSNEFNWEFFILQQIRSRLGKPRYSYAGDLLENLQFPNCNCLLLVQQIDVHTLASCIQLFSSQGLAIPEPVVLYLAISLLRAVREIHSIGIVHGAIRPESILLTYDRNAISLVDFSRAIDVRSFPEHPKVRFRHPGDSSILQNHVFSYEIDYLHCSQVVFQLLCGRAAPLEASAQGRYSLSVPNAADHWRDFFQQTLGCGAAADSFPVIDRLTQRLEEVHLKNRSFDDCYFRFCDKLIDEQAPVPMQE